MVLVDEVVSDNFEHCQVITPLSKGEFTLNDYGHSYN